MRGEGSGLDGRGAVRVSVGFAIWIVVTILAAFLVIYLEKPL